MKAIPLVFQAGDTHEPEGAGQSCLEHGSAQLTTLLTYLRQLLGLKDWAARTSQSEEGSEKYKRDGLLPTQAF